MTAKLPKVADVRMDAATLAVLMTDPQDASHGLGMARTWTPSVGAKRVRSIARDTIDRFINRTGYTAHAYTVDEARAIVAASSDAGRGAPTVNADALRAALAPKTSKAPRARRTASKAAASADVAQDVAS